MKHSSLLSRLFGNSSSGWLSGLMGVLIFSGSLPATRLAVVDLPPFFLTAARASIAGLLSLLVLIISKVKRPRRSQLFPLAIVAVGVVLGYPLLSALALQYITSAHAIIFVGILPVMTALFGILRAGEQPLPAFWIFSIAGCLLVIGYGLGQGATASPAGDLLMLLAILLCAMGYAEGARLSKMLGGMQVIAWALVLSLPIMLPLSLFLLPVQLASVGFPAWSGLAYVSVFSMFIGFVFWYRGLAKGGIAAVGQIQLLQPFFGLALAAIVLHEDVSIGMLGVTVGVMLCVAGSKKYASLRKRKAGLPNAYPTKNSSLSIGTQKDPS